MSDAAERWERIERLYHEALDRNPGDRAAFLDEACADDAGLRAEVASLLAVDTEASRFLTRSALEQVAGRLPRARPGALIGRQIHGYEIRSLLGVGGMGEVYRATDLRLGRDVALKILHRHGDMEPGYVRRFEDEARSASVLNHPNIVTIYGVGEEPDISYIAMECVAGRTLGELVAGGKLDTAASLDLAVQLADALAAAHGKGIIHRDLKPDNVMVTADGRLKVLDFGIAKREGVVDAADPLAPEPLATGGATEAGQILGTVGYMSPEQAAGRKASAASDQFSFGAILYELLSGRRAFARPTRLATLEAIQREHPEPIVISNATARRPLRRVLERCLAKDPAQRYESTRELAHELRVVRDQVEGRTLTRRQALWLGTAAAGVIAAGGTAAGWFLWTRGPRVRAIALLPFENTGQDAGLEHLCKGLTDTLIERVGEMASIRVMTHSLVSNFKRSGLDARSFARSIEADSYLVGSITRSAGALTITAALSEVDTGKKLWSNSFSRSDTDIQAIQEAIAKEIVYDGVRLHLSDGERNRLVRRLTDNKEAYELYLKAGLLLELETPDGLIRQRELLAQAIALDPKFSRVYTLLAGSYASAALEGWEPPADCWPKVQSYTREGISRDRDFPDGYITTALYEFFFNWRWDLADAAWREAMRARGAAMYPYHLVGRALQEFALGRTGDAVRTMGEVRQLDRLSPLYIAKEANYLFADHEVVRAEEGYLSALRADPDLDMAWFGLADVRHAQRRWDDVIEIHRRRLGGRNADFDRVLAAAHGEDGCRRIQHEMARLMALKHDIQAASGDYVAPIERAKTFAQLGDTTKALRFLEEALAIRDPGVVFLRVDPAWRSLRDQPRFQAVVKEVRLPA